MTTEAESSHARSPYEFFGKVLITGGCGFLGSHLVEALATEPQCTVVAISRNPSRYRIPNATYLTCDVTNHDEVLGLIQEVRPRVIVHAVTPGPFAPPLAHYKDYLATQNLLEAARLSKSVKAFVYAGSAEAVSNASGLRSTPLTEEDSILHTLDSGPSSYGRYKAASDALVLKTNTQTSVSFQNDDGDNFSGQLLTAVLRIPAMYGPRDTLIFSKIAQAANTFATRIQLGENKTVLDNIYVKSAAYAHVLAVKALLAPARSEELRVDGEAFSISDGEPMKFWDFARKIWAEVGDKNSKEPGRIIIVPWWPVLAMAAVYEWIFYIVTLGRKTPGFSRHHVQYMKDGAWFDIEKARKRLGYVPLVDTYAGIRETAVWFKQRAEMGPSKSK